MKLPSKTKSALMAGVLTLATPFVADFEGFSAKAYRDPIGIPTICYGHIKGVEMGMIYSKEKCRELLDGELSYALTAVDASLTRRVPDTTRAALASFTYNLGVSALRGSTMLRKINAGDLKGGCNELNKWVYAKGKKLPGLVRRRAAERDLCLKGDPLVIAKN